MSHYPIAAKRASLYEGLALIDQDLAQLVRVEGCPHCGGRLDYATWLRKPRGLDVPLPDSVVIRRGLCCARCRRRVLPPSTVFLGRKVYFAAVILVSIASRQRRIVGATADALRKMFGVSRQTLARWLGFFRVDLPVSPPWIAVRGLVPASVRNDSLPNGLLTELDQLHGAGEAALQAFLQLLARGALHVLRGA